MNIPVSSCLHLNLALVPSPFLSLPPSLIYMYQHTQTKKWCWKCLALLPTFHHCQQKHHMRSDVILWTVSRWAWGEAIKKNSAYSRLVAAKGAALFHGDPWADTKFSLCSTKLILPGTNATMPNSTTVIVAGVSQLWVARCSIQRSKPLQRRCISMYMGLFVLLERQCWEVQDQI